jgi:hypothetical protein
MDTGVQRGEKDSGDLPPECIPGKYTALNAGCRDYQVMASLPGTITKTVLKILRITFSDPTVSFWRENGYPQSEVNMKGMTTLGTDPAKPWFSIDFSKGSSKIVLKEDCFVMYTTINFSGKPNACLKIGSAKKGDPAPPAGCVKFQMRFGFKMPMWAVTDGRQFSSSAFLKTNMTEEVDAIAKKALDPAYKNVNFADMKTSFWQPVPAAEQPEYSLIQSALMYSHRHKSVEHRGYDPRELKKAWLYQQSLKGNTFSENEQLHQRLPEYLMQVGGACSRRTTTRSTA